MLNGISIKSQISLAIAAFIMTTFFVMEVLVVLEVIAASYSVAVFGLLCLLAFMPPFVVILSEFLINIKIKEERINSQLEGISRSNLVVTLTMDGYILKANPNFCSIMGCEEGHVIMQPHERMVTPEYADSEEYANFWATLRQGHSITGKFERVAKDGSKRWLYGNYTPIKNKDGVFDRVLKIATDVTTAHLAEEIVSQKTAYLEHVTICTLALILTFHGVSRPSSAVWTRKQ
jgi:PAS domain S-box-containing protein